MKNTTENNKLIAEFMEMPSHTNNKGTLYTRLNEITGETEFLVAEELEFERSWDWLMPVIEKAEGYGTSILIGRFFCEIKYTDALNQENHFEIRMASGVKLNACYGAIVEFIKWYNENKED